MFAISNNDSVLYDAIVGNHLDKCHEMPKDDIMRELEYRYRFGVVGQCPLHVAVLVANPMDCTRRDRALEIIKWLLRAGAELEVENVLGWTPLKSAIANADVATTSLLVSAGASISFENSDSNGRSALHLACMGLRYMSNECFNMIQYLVEQRVDVSLRDMVGFVLKPFGICTPLLRHSHVVLFKFRVEILS
jgi:ankyrin repeat protein